MTDRKGVVHTVLPIKATVLTRLGESHTCAGVTFGNFKTLSQEQVSELIKKAAIK